jgi:hypothetical protein
MKSGILAALLGAAVSVHAPDGVARDPRWSDIPYVVVGSFKSYAGAERHVAMLEARTGIAIYLRNLDFSKGVLTLDDDDCVHDGTAKMGAECFVPRARSDTGGLSLSIERSDWYPTMTPGYYVVVVAVGAGETLAVARAALAPAGIKGYVVHVPTYFGCSQ